MKLYEFDEAFEKALAESIDQDTGEIKDFSLLEELNIAKEEKVKNLALWHVELEAEEEQIAKQLKKFLAMKKSIRRQIEWLEDYIAKYTDKKEYKFTEVKISYSRSEETVIVDKEAFERAWKKNKSLGTMEIKPDKKAIKEYIASGHKLKCVEIVEKKNIQIK